MNYWLLPLAFLVGGMLLKWLLDLFFLRGHFDDLERRLNTREADYSTLKHEHSQALTDLRNRLTELDATAKSKLVAEGNLAKGQSDLAALRAHLLRTDEELKTLRVLEAECSLRCADRERERDTYRQAADSLRTELQAARSALETRGLRTAELEAMLATASGTAESLGQEAATLRTEAVTTTQRVIELEGQLAAQQSVTTTLENAIRGRDAQLADFPARLAALDAERHSIATSLGVADRELALVRAELAQTTPKLELANNVVATRDVDLKALRQQLELAQKALKEAKAQGRTDAETAAAAAQEHVATAVRWKMEADEIKRISEATAAENRRLEDDLKALRQTLATAEQTRLVATTAPLLADPAAAELSQRLRDVEAELEIVSQSHAQLELELMAARHKIAAPAPPHPTATDGGPLGSAALLAEIDELNRERNTLAAELAALRSVGAGDSGPPSPAPRKRKSRAPEVDLFATGATASGPGSAPAEPAPAARSEGPPHLPAETPADGPAESEAVQQFSVRCPQHLSDVRGIGSVFEQRLYAAGVGSYWELSQLSDRTLTEVLELDERQREQYEFAATRADAHRLAEESRTVGQKWTGETPDDLEPLEGIGSAIEKRLYEAGICTFAALAQASVELLSEICPVAKFRGANYVSWIEQARQRLSTEEI